MDLLHQLSKKAFWDTDICSLDVEKHAAYIIVKVLEYGGWQDIKAVVKYYGKEKVRQVAQNHSFFFPDTMHFIATVFNLKEEDLACYRNKPYQNSAYN